MKKIALILLLGVISLTTFSQSRPQADQSLKYGDTWSLYLGKNADTIGVGDSTWTRVVNKLTTDKVGVEWRIYLDSLSGTADTVDLFFYYSTHGLTYTLEDTVTWYGTQDTLIIFDDDTTRVGDYNKVFIRERGDNFKFRIDTVANKFYYE